MPRGTFVLINYSITFSGFEVTDAGFSINTFYGVESPSPQKFALQSKLMEA